MSISLKQGKLKVKGPDGVYRSTMDILSDRQIEDIEAQLTEMSSDIAQLQNDVASLPSSDSVNTAIDTAIGNVQTEINQLAATNVNTENIEANVKQSITNVTEWTSAEKTSAQKKFGFVPLDSQADYDSIAIHDSATFYFIKEE